MLTEYNKGFIDPTLQRLSRVTSTKRFIPEIDGLRFIAIITVVLLHLRTAILKENTFGIEGNSFDQNTLLWIISKGGLGVSLFFAISGFILGLPFALYHKTKSNKINLKKYYLRRLTRLEPPYIVAVSLFFVIHIVVLGQSFTALFPNYLASIFYVHYFTFDAWSEILPVAWSLETEVQFYILAPFLSLLFGLRGRFLRIVVIISLILINHLWIREFFPFIETYHLTKSLTMYLMNFLAGYLMVELYVNSDLLGADRKKYFLFDFIGVLGIIGVFYFHAHPSFLLRYSPFCFATALLFFAAFRGRIFNYFFTRKIITVIGGMCYTIYLVHYPFLLFSGQLLKSTATDNFNTTFFIHAIIILPLLLIFSSLFFLIFEKPFMYKDWPEKVKFRLESITQRWIG